LRPPSDVIDNTPSMPFRRVNDIDMYYEDTGAKAGTAPVLLLHGLGSSTRDWEYQWPALAGAYRVVACDLRGHYRTTKARGPYSVPQLAADVIGLLESLDLPAAHLVGISMGGMVGIELALDAPERVRSLTVVNAGPHLDFSGLRTRAMLGLRLTLLRLAGMRPVGWMLAREMFPEKGQEELRRKVARRWAENDTRCYLESAKAVLAYDARQRVSGIRCPTLVVRGGLDLTPMELDASRLPRARRVVIPGSRHATVVDAAGRFNELLLQFISPRDWPGGEGGP